MAALVSGLTSAEMTGEMVYSEETGEKSGKINQAAETGKTGEISRVEGSVEA